MARSRRARNVVAGCVAAALLAASGASAAAPVTFVWPTSIAVEPDGSLLVVENGLHRLVRVDPSSGRTTVVASGMAKPYAVARARSGAIYVTDAGALERIDGTRAPRVVARVTEDIGPIALAPDGDVYFTTSTELFRLTRAGGKPVRVATGLAGPHGIAVAPDGAVLVADTDAHRVLRVDPRTGAASTLMKVANPRGIAVAADGTIDVVAADAHRVARFSAAGKRLGRVGSRFGDPYALAVTPAAIYVIDTSATGTIVRVGRDGAVRTLAG
jgi:sugar lactone lactonase YvrE